MCTRPREIHEVMNLEVILLVSSEFSLDHFFHLQPRPVSTLHESSKKFIIRSQPWMNWLKNKTLSLGTASEEIFFHDSVSISICISEKKIWKISVSTAKIFFVSNTFKAEKRQKFVKNRQKMGYFHGKSAIFSLNSWPQYMISRYFWPFSMN